MGQVVEELTGPDNFRYESATPAIDSRYHFFETFWLSKPGQYQLKFSVNEDGRDVRHL